jgi:hypothetical protein
MHRLLPLALSIVLVIPAVPAYAEDEFQNIPFFYPLVTRRPVIERELELRVLHDKGRGGRSTEVTGAIEWPLLPRWQVELEVPLIFASPAQSRDAGGIGDLRLENKIAVWNSIDHSAQLAVGMEARFPTGSARRGLGGEAAVEPFVTGGIAFGPVDILADVGWEFNINAHVKGAQEQELGAGVAVAYILHRNFAPLLELRTATLTRAAADDELRHRTRVSVIPGFNARLLPRTTLRMGLELPVTDARRSDYVLHAGFVWEF